MRYRSLVAPLLLAAAVVVAVPGTACACSCVALEPAEQVENAETVFTGTVVAARRIPGDRSGPTPPIVYRLRPDQVYKGAPAAEVEVATNPDGASCGYAFTVGSRYLVFARGGESGMFATDPGVPLHTSLCDGNRQVRPGDGPLRGEDGVQGGEPLGRDLLSALGTARPPSTAPGSPQETPSPEATESPETGLSPEGEPSPEGTMTASPVAGRTDDGPSVPWAPIGGAAAAAALALAGRRLLRRRVRRAPEG
ncbi:hypothetical protein ACFFMN_05645 [Planobispora siamensis]|uniref:Tissue inhibitor of metalloproteinase n=1 Tax=Planobispora siamensis TaxID=936338 RepID=A0A8J3SJB4_9ACTN|nr:hypothetical protein [Planobispora siamensis]GIH94334.1 hypothetical protein Psi01_49640 [Planobispora siamensis]